MNAPSRITAEANDLTATAHSIILIGAGQTLGCSMSADEEKEWLTAAHYLLDTDDTDELAYMIERMEAAEYAEGRAYDWEVRHGRDVPDWMVDRWIDDYAARPAETYVPGAGA